MKCPLCQSSNNIQIFTAPNVHGRHEYGREKFKFYECNQCHCIFPRVALTKNFYKKYYPQKKYNLKPSNLEKIYSSFNYFLRKKYLPKKGTLLDVGCGQGQYINSLPPAITATGIDLNTGNSNASNLIKADFNKHEFTNKYDIITFWHSLEHFQDPKNTINKAIKLLKTNGKIIISLPNTNSLAYKLGKINWFHLDSPRHLFLPSNKNIQYLFPKNSHFKIKYFPFEFPLDLFWSLKSFPYLRIIYPILKCFDHETMTVIYQNN